MCLPALWPQPRYSRLPGEACSVWALAGHLLPAGCAQLLCRGPGIFLATLFQRPLLSSFLQAESQSFPETGGLRAASTPRSLETAPQRRVRSCALDSGGGAGWASHLFSLSNADPASPAAPGRAPRAHTSGGNEEDSSPGSPFSSGPDAASGPGLPPSRPLSRPSKGPLHTPLSIALTLPGGPSALFPPVLPWSPSWHLRQLAPEHMLICFAPHPTPTPVLLVVPPPTGNPHCLAQPQLLTHSSPIQQLLSL